MKIFNNIEINNRAISANLKRLTNQTYKLLPNREENLDWKTPLSTIIEELSGMATVLPDLQENIFSLLCKLEGLKVLQEDNFFEYRRTIFECLNIIQALVKIVEEEV